MKAKYSDYGMKEEYFSCLCHSDEHTIRFTYFEDQFDDIEDAEIYLSVFLNEYSFFKRLWLGIKYIFGYKCRYGHFGCWSLKPNDAKRLKELIEKLEKFYKEEDAPQEKN